MVEDQTQTEAINVKLQETQTPVIDSKEMQTMTHVVNLNVRIQCSFLVEK